MAFQFGFLARLTWWEYSWDIMEPVTYFVGYGTAIVFYAYFVITRQVQLSIVSFIRSWEKYVQFLNSKYKIHTFNIQLIYLLSILQTNLHNLHIFCCYVIVRLKIVSTSSFQVDIFEFLIAIFLNPTGIPLPRLTW